MTIVFHTDEKYVKDALYMYAENEPVMKDGSCFK